MSAISARSLRLYGGHFSAQLHLYGGHFGAELFLAGDHFHPQIVDRIGQGVNLLLEVVNFLVKDFDVVDDPAQQECAPDQQDDGGDDEAGAREPGNDHGDEGGGVHRCMLQFEGSPIVGAGGAAGKRTPAGAGRSRGCGYAFWRWYTWIRWRLASTTNSLSWASRRTETGPQK